MGLEGKMDSYIYVKIIDEFDAIKKQLQEHEEKLELAKKSFLTISEVIISHSNRIERICKYLRER